MVHQNRFVRTILALLITLQSVVAEEDYNQFTVCADSSIVVEELSISCDSPGSYYYGSNKYRNSATCMGGDKAKLDFVFEIVDDLQASPYISVEVEAYGSVPAKNLYTQVELCSLGTLQSYSGAACPAAGIYMISEKFYFDAQSDDYSYNFKPVPSIGFMSSLNQNYFDLGGANTDSCKGGTFQNWSTSMGNSASKTIRFFLITFGALLALSLTFLAWRYYAMKRELNVGTRKVESMQEELLDDEDVRRIAMMGREKDLIDA